MNAKPGTNGQPLSVELSHSRPSLLAVDEPQVLYTLVSIRPGKDPDRPLAPDLNLCIALDRSTSMAGERLDTARSSVAEILRRLRPQDHLSLLTFSDRAEILVGARSTDSASSVEGRLNQIQTSGGTEIFQGLQAALAEIREGRRTGAIDHIILITDGQTYGDEENCRQLAEQAAQEGTEITAVGIGAEWNDVFLDSLASRTGGQAVFIDQVSTLAHFMREKFHGFGQVYSDRLTLEIATNPGVILRAAFRISPSPTPLPTQTFLRLGTLYQGSTLSLLLELLFSPLSATPSFEVGNLTFGAHLVPQNEELQSVLSLAFPVTEEVVPTPISGPLLAAVRSVTLYELQERAVIEAKAGHVERATRKLNRLATQLLELGESSVANTVIGEAEQLSLEHHLSESGQKRMKYGTRSLMEARSEVPR